MKCGLLGGKLGHSYSPQIHQRLGNYTYDLYEKSPDELEDFLKHGDFTGLNVTIPYKKSVMEYCDELTPIAKRLGAVNTVIRTDQGKLLGHNSDYFGFASMLLHSGLNPKGKRVLVLGTGGASATVQAVLKDMGANVAVISRNGKHNYRNMFRFYSTEIIVNATPVGMYPNTGESLVNLNSFHRLKGVLDLVYNPARTKLVQDALDRNLIAENGLWMLVAQAKESAQYFLGKPIDDEIIPGIYQQLRKQMENIVLIGMPGSGKSTIGKLLAHALNRPFYDADSSIEDNAGMSIPEIFARYGEMHFRQLETQTLEQLGKLSGAVIATGGGCVTQPQNYQLLHQNSRVIWLKRNLYMLPSAGRPLSQQHSVFALYEARMPLYMRFADNYVNNDFAPDVTVNQILMLEESQ